MSEVYSYSEAQLVIDEAWDKAVDHLKLVLGDQYSYCVTSNAKYDFKDKVEQDIEYLKECVNCGEVSGECYEHAEKL